MTERRYTEEEIRKIFDVAVRASSTSPTDLAHADGLTLADLQAIGGEVGITPEAVAHAAQTLEVRKAGRSRSFLGLPTGVERQVALRRRLTDLEWEQLVVQLREVFSARGAMRTDGSLRQWTNGNLYVLLEPTPTGDRLRLGSFHRGAANSLRFGVFALGAAVLLAAATLVGGPLVDTSTIVTLLAGGAVLTANGALRLPGWARLRARQMEELAAQLALPPGAETGPSTELEPSG